MSVFYAYFLFASRHVASRLKKEKRIIKKINKRENGEKLGKNLLELTRRD